MKKMFDFFFGISLKFRLISEIIFPLTNPLNDEYNREQRRPLMLVWSFMMIDDNPNVMSQCQYEINSQNN